MFECTKYQTILRWSYFCWASYNQEQFKSFLVCKARTLLSFETKSGARNTNCATLLIGGIYIAESGNNRVQVFSYNGEYVFMFSEKMNSPIGICISQNRVFVAQWYSHCINKYELEGKLIKSVGSEGNGEAQFKYPLGLDVSDRTNNIYVCDSLNHRVQILTEELKYHSVLGINLFGSPLDVKGVRLHISIFNDKYVRINKIRKHINS